MMYGIQEICSSGARFGEIGFPLSLERGGAYPSLLPTKKSYFQLFVSDIRHSRVIWEPQQLASEMMTGHVANEISTYVPCFLGEYQKASTWNIGSVSPSTVY